MIAAIYNAIKRLIDKTFNDEDTNYKFSVDLTGKFLIAITGLFAYLSSDNTIIVNDIVKYIILFLGISSSVFCFLSIEIKNLIFITSIFCIIFISSVGSFQQTTLSLLFIVPVFLSYFSHNRKFIFSNLIFSLILFNLSKIFKAVNIYLSLKNVEFIRILVSSVGVSLFESILFALILVPIISQLIRQNDSLKIAIKEKTEATDDILLFCSTAASFHNKYLAAHITGVKEITEVILDFLIQNEIYIDPLYYKQIVFSVQFHDIGKLYIDSAILDKKEKLSYEEIEIIKEHPERGLELFDKLPKNVLDANYTRVCRNVIVQHHEKLDGSGYPYGLIGDEISLEAQIVTVADITDALLSWRPYKSPMEWDKMVEILLSDKNKYNDLCVQAIIENKNIILGISNKNNKILQSSLKLEDSDIIRC